MNTVIDFKKLSSMVPYSRPHLYRLEAKGAFPKRLQLGPNRVGWLEKEVIEWIAARSRQRWREVSLGEAFP